MSLAPKLSVVMPVYNAQQFLQQAIDSILQQTLSDFEFILIDDCSTDASVAIIQSYTDPRIKLYRNEENLGISPTLNKGITLATTNLIARMDADDVSYPDRLQKQYDYLQSHPACAMVSAWVRVINEDGAYLQQSTFDSELYYYNLVFICWIYHPTVMYRKAAVQQVGMYTVPYSEDFELFWQLSRQFTISNLPELLLDYRITKQSLHQVLKKPEYLHAQQAQVLRNIRYYTGDDFSISDTHLSCLRHIFEPLLAEQNVGSIIECLKKLDFISNCISKKEDDSRKAIITKAATYKRGFIISFFTKNLPIHKGIFLLIRLKLFRLIFWEFLHI